jgi:hypothetical protein
MSMFVWASAEYAPERDELRMAGRMKLTGALQEEPGNLGSRIGETGKETTRRGATGFMTILCSRRARQGRISPWGITAQKQCSRIQLAERR